MQLLELACEGAFGEMEKATGLSGLTGQPVAFGKETALVMSVRGDRAHTPVYRPLLRILASGP